jgi:hypothetical protein
MDWPTAEFMFVGSFMAVAEAVVVVEPGDT